MVAFGEDEEVKVGQWLAPADSMGFERPTRKCIEPHDLPRQSHSCLPSPALARLGILLALCRQPLRKQYLIVFA